MATFAQDQYGGFLITNGKTQILQGAAAGAVKLFNQFRLFRGAWFRDTRVGIPYFLAIFGVKNPNLGVATQFFRSVILGTDGVKDTTVTVTFDRGSRAANVAFDAKWDDGSVITADALDKPFLVNVPQGATH